ncbi:MAG: TPM domain-containing protein, partial [Candidatus Limnocylindria bacterium]
MRSGWWARVALAGALLSASLTLASAALAQDVPALREPITDLAGALDGDAGAAESALDELLQERDVQLYALFVDSTDGLSVTEYAETVFSANSLGGNDALLVVAIDDRRDALWVGDGFDDVIEADLTDSEIDDVLANHVEPELRDGDFEGAVVAAADAIDGATDPGVGGGTILLIVIGVVVAVVIGLWLWGAIQRSGRTRRAAEERDRRTGQLAREANALLLQTDEAVRNAEQELAFAEAQFSEGDVKPYRVALEQARGELKAAFLVRQQLDDAVPETPEAREKMLRDVVERCRRAQGVIDEHRDRFRQLRDLERTAPEVLQKLPGELDELERRTAGAGTTLSALEAYAESSWRSVKGNVVEAQKRLSTAREQLAAGERSVAANDRPAAARSTRAAQLAAGEARSLLDAIDRLAQSLEQAQRTLPAELAAAETDVRAATAALESDARSDARPRLAEATSALETAHREAKSPRPDVLTALQLATKANAIADEILAAARQTAERRVRERQVADATYRSAEAAYNRAADYITARRHGVGREARTRLAEAERHLEVARSLLRSDSARSLDEARRASELADDGYRLAQSDFNRYDSYGGGLFGGGGGTRGG